MNFLIRPADDLDQVVAELSLHGAEHFANRLGENNLVKLGDHHTNGVQSRWCADVKRSVRRMRRASGAPVRQGVKPE